MTKKLNPERGDTANPEWSDEDFAKAKPASDVLAGLFGNAQAKEMLKPKRGRPKSATTKEHVNVRLDSDVLAQFKASGPGWQTLMNAALADWLKTHTPDELKA
ncbi:BrnA antitoxin family protein [Pseudomonas sp. NPDC096917]|uniref:BrnA antitoxin family protein n=1 Tax=Pseudomonas sp. NPDC096917 TaxID=3364483 RepID=UPI00383B7CB6